MSNKYISKGAVKRQTERHQSVDGGGKHGEKNIQPEPAPRHDADSGE